MGELTRAPLGKGGVALEKFKILLMAVCAISALGAVADGKERQKGFVALFIASGVLFLVAWALQAAK